MDNDLLVDVYEPEYFRQGLADIGTVVALPTGDYVWQDAGGKSVAIERKDTGDLLTSFNNGRLTDQLQRMVAEYDFPFLLIEGVISQDSSGLIKIWQNGGQLSREFPYSMIQLMLVEAQLSGAILVNSTSKASSLTMIRKLYEWSKRPEHNLLNRRKKPFQLGTKIDKQVYLLMGLPGIGEDSARGLIEEFGSPIAALQGLILAPKVAMKVRGIAKTKIDRAREVLLPRNHE